MRFILFLFLAFALPAQAAQPTPTNDADFIAANDAFRAGDRVKLARLASRFKKSPLEVYIAYYQLRLDLGRADTGAVRAFLDRPEDTPMIDRLRGEWLKLLAERQQWDEFDAESPRLINEDNELACHALQSRSRSQPQAVLQEARMLLWFSGKAQPGNCGPLFDAAIAAGIITEPDIWQRLRLVLETGNVSLAMKLAAKLDDAGLVASLRGAAADADRYLGKLTLNKESRGQRVAALFALLRLAKQSPDLSIARWEKLAAEFPEAEQRYYYGWLAYEAARKQDARALQWYRAAAGAPLNEQQSAWWVRSALRAQDWPAALSAIDAMSPRQQREPAWQYWKARALKATGNPAEAEKLLAPLSAEYHFYGQLAADDLTAPVLSAAAPNFKPNERDIASMQAMPGMQRTLTLYRTGLRTEALKEWSWTLRNFNDHELLTASEIARRNEMYDRAINAADRTVNVHDFSLRYLAPYRDALQPHIKEQGLDEAWVYGLMRQESRFVTAAKSNVGAAGLMQIMPSTASWIARRLGLKDYRRSLLDQLDTNLKLGTYYMKTVLNWFDDSPVLASAAYNAGPSRARRWRGELPLEGAIYAETIPFDETRDYVKKVMSNTIYYSRQFGAPQKSLKQRMGIVAAKTQDNQQAIPDEK
jgi:soluble lytic murein transglycosylase